MSISILNLNNDIIEIILKYLNDIDVMNFYKTCKALYYSNFNYKWKNYYDIEYENNEDNENIYKYYYYQFNNKIDLYL